MIEYDKISMDPTVNGISDLDEMIIQVGDAESTSASSFPSFTVNLISLSSSGAMKKYLQEYCDYTYSSLQKNIPDALKSVDVLTIQKWEHQMIRWMDAYREGQGTK